jgi:hypothetical protein
MKQGMSIFTSQSLMVHFTVLVMDSYTLSILSLAKAGSDVLDWPTCPMLGRNTCLLMLSWALCVYTHRYIVLVLLSPLLVVNALIDPLPHPVLWPILQRYRSWIPQELWAFHRGFVSHRRLGVVHLRISVLVAHHKRRARSCKWINSDSVDPGSFERTRIFRRVPSSNQF